jgi:hypothetical protein
MADQIWEALGTVRFKRFLCYISYMPCLGNEHFHWLPHFLLRVLACVRVVKYGFKA